MRKTCRLIEINRSTIQYQPTQNRDTELTTRMITLHLSIIATEAPGCMYYVCKKEGLVFNHKRTECIYRKE